MLTIKITPNDKGNPPGKLADAKLHFSDGPKAGLKLIGFGIWESRGGSRRNVTLPARSYAINGERRSYALLRPIDDTAGQERIRQAIVEAYEAYGRGLLQPAEDCAATRPIASCGLRDDVTTF